LGRIEILPGESERLGSIAKGAFASLDRGLGVAQQFAPFAASALTGVSGRCRRVRRRAVSCGKPRVAFIVAVVPNVTGPLLSVPSSWYDADIGLALLLENILNGSSFARLLS
jgi:hypothetical protein